MKKLAIFCAAAVLVMSLVACGCQADRPTGNTPGSGTTNSGTNNGTTNNGTTNSGTNNRPGSNAGNNMQGPMDDFGDAMDDMGNAVEDMLPGTNNSGTANNGTTNGGAANNGTGNNTANGVNPTGFQRMLENARVHDSDGDLTDGENSQW